MFIFQSIHVWNINLQKGCKFTNDKGTLNTYTLVSYRAWYHYLSSIIYYPLSNIDYLLSIIIYYIIISKCMLITFFAMWLIWRFDTRNFPIPGISRFELCSCDRLRYIREIIIIWTSVESCKVVLQLTLNTTSLNFKIKIKVMCIILLS